ncbi:MAG: tRNA 4-thiouridine(8) synthase ThiI [Candidatus Omnitrophica bacterium]|nr:tRNA 4-thiouridine(8) synthase ThiI [Candidatus Omnitrophota bacterium]
MTKALALISGGLDSILAAKAIKDLGVDVIGVYFKTPFCLRKKKDITTSTELANELSQNAGIELKIVELNDEFLAIVRHPKHGYGKNINPCIDCKILMLRKAREMMESLGASFLISGEVLGQRPMSQHHPALDMISKEAEVEGILLRPLSAKHLEPTIPEQKGWVDRDKLFDFSGRTRRPQMELAVMLGVIDYPNASGGCLLTDPLFSKRLRDLMKFGVYDMKNVALLKVGRHYRFAYDAKLIVGRDEAENTDIEKLAQDGDILFVPPPDLAGPSALARGNFSEDQLKLSAGIIARYCDLAGKLSIDISYRKLPESDWRVLNVAPVPDEESEKYRL